MTEYNTEHTITQYNREQYNSIVLNNIVICPLKHIHRGRVTVNSVVQNRYVILGNTIRVPRHQSVGESITVNT